MSHLIDISLLKTNRDYSLLYAGQFISFIGTMLGNARAGVIASIFGTTTTIVSGSILSIIAVITCCIFMPKFWNYKNK